MVTKNIFEQRRESLDINFFERRRESLDINFDDRRKEDRRDKIISTDTQRRRLASQVRRYERERLRIPVCIKVGDKEIPGYTHDISPEGLSVYSDTALDVALSDSILMTLQFSFGNVCNLKIFGYIVSCREKTIAIKFSQIRDWEQKILSFAVKELTQSAATQEKSVLNIIQVFDPVNLIKPRQESLSHYTRKSAVHASKVIGWGAYLPPDEFKSEQINSLVKAGSYKNVGKVVEALTGIKSRRYAGSDVYPSDLAAMAANNALKSAGMDPKDLDMIIFCGISHDVDEPATANIVQEKIGAKNAYVFDVVNACNGFVTAVDTLDGMISAGRCENGIIVTGERAFPYVDWEPKTKKDFKLSIFGYTIGDAGGAAVLTRAHPSEKRGIRARWFSSEGDYWRLALAGTLEGANPSNKFFRSEGVELEKASIKFAPKGFKEITQLLGWTMSDIDLVIPHQIPITFTENLYHKALAIPPAKLMWAFPDYGNMATASMPVAVCEAIKATRVKEGDKVVFAGVAAGFNVGFIGLVF